MVEPIYIIAIALGVAFLLPIIKKSGTVIFNTIFFLTLVTLAAISAAWLSGFLFEGIQICNSVQTKHFLLLPSIS